MSDSTYTESTRFNPNAMQPGVVDDTEALVLWTRYLFDRTDGLRLDFATYSGNLEMLAVGRRAGHTEEALLRQARRRAGGVHDAVGMGVLRAEWIANRESGTRPGPTSDDGSVAKIGPFQRPRGSRADPRVTTT